MMTFTVPIGLPGRVIITPVCGFFTFFPLVMMLNAMPSLMPWLLPPAISVASLSQERKLVFHGLFVHLFMMFSTSWPIASEMALSLRVAS